MKLSVLMPVYNESPTLRAIVARVMNAPVSLELELVCVDDHSTDDSLEILEDLARGDDRIRVVAQPRNMGKGRAIRTAIEKMSGDIGIIQDADLEYDPKDYARMLAPLIEGSADAVFGSRFASSEQRRVLFFWHSLGNKLLTLLSNMANDLNLTDMETCYKAVRGDLLKSLRLTSDRFGLEPEITARLARSGARIYEVPISYHGRTYAEGKKIGWRDGVEAIWLIFKFRFLDSRHLENPDQATLESLAAAPTIGKWVFEQFRPYLGESVLEAGAGPGNLTRFLIDRPHLTSVDINQDHVTVLSQRYVDVASFTAEAADLDDPATYERLKGPFDTVLCVNVIEHLAHPQVAITGFERILTQGGHVLLLVPAHQSLFSPADKALGHLKRYSRTDLEYLLRAAGLETVVIREFNRLGVMGWRANRALHQTSIAPTQAKLFGWLLPVARVAERFDALPGLSWIVVARKP